MLCCLFFFFYCYGDHRDLHSFPTRRSSDLARHERAGARRGAQRRSRPGAGARLADTDRAWAASPRSEEHTSELQSLTNLVCRLLLEKKKKKKNRRRQSKK